MKKIKNRFPLWWLELVIIGLLILVFVFMFQLEKSNQLRDIKDHQDRFSTSVQAYRSQYIDNTSMTDSELRQIMWNVLKSGDGSWYSNGKIQNEHRSVAMEFFDAEGNPILSSWDRNLLMQGYPVPMGEADETIYFCLEEWFADSDIDDFLETTKEAWNVSYVMGWFDDVEGFVPVEIRYEAWDGNANAGDFYILENAALKAPIPEEHRVYLVNNNSQYVPDEAMNYIEYEWWFDSCNVLEGQNDAAFANIQQIFNLKSEDEITRLCNAKGFGASGGGFEGVDSCYYTVCGAGVYGVATTVYSLGKMTLTSTALWSRMTSLIIVIQGGALVGFYIRRKMKQKQNQIDHMRSTFINAMAHEMKTPAAVIKNSTECILDEVCPEKNRHYLEMISKETDHMNDLLSKMLVYTRTSDAVYALRLIPLHLMEMVERVGVSYQVEMEQRGLKFVVKNQGMDEVYGDPDLIKMVVDNYISNAVKHAKENSEIVVTLYGTHCAVFNQGECLTEEQLERIWEPLYVIDAARSETDGSAGMGLAICKNILELHNAKYGVENTDGGVRFYFTLP